MSVKKMLDKAIKVMDVTVFSPDTIVDWNNELDFIAYVKRKTGKNYYFDSDQLVDGRTDKDVRGAHLGMKFKDLMNKIK